MWVLLLPLILLVPDDIEDRVRAAVFGKDEAIGYTTEQLAYFPSPCRMPVFNEWIEDLFGFDEKARALGDRFSGTKEAARLVREAWLAGGYIATGQIDAARDVTDLALRAFPDNSELNILAALKVPFEAGASAIELSEVYEANVKEETKGDMIFYAYSPADRAGETLAVVVEFAGPGLWGPVKGFLALEPDMKTIRGLTFYQQEETSLLL